MALRRSRVRIPLGPSDKASKLGAFSLPTAQQPPGGGSLQLVVQEQIPMALKVSRAAGPSGSIR